jgi:hypothetical protein
VLSQLLGPYWEGLLTGVMVTLTPSLLTFFVLVLTSSQDEDSVEHFPHGDENERSSELLRSKDWSR